MLRGQVEERDQLIRETRTEELLSRLKPYIEYENGEDSVCAFMQPIFSNPSLLNEEENRKRKILLKLYKKLSKKDRKKLLEILFKRDRQGEEYAVQALRCSPDELRRIKANSKRDEKLAVPPEEKKRNQSDFISISRGSSPQLSMEYQQPAASRRVEAGAQFVFSTPTPFPPRLGGAEIAEIKSSLQQRQVQAVPLPLPAEIPTGMDEKDRTVVYQTISYDQLKLEQKLGSGVFGDVHQGTYLGKAVAIKRLRASMSESTADELTKEAKIMAKTRSRWLVTLEGVCLTPQHVCLVMELMPKGSLYQLLQNNNGGSGLPLFLKFRIAMDMAKGLDHLHSAGIVHRDIKSENVLLDDRLNAKLGDFGLARTKEEIERKSFRGEEKFLGAHSWMAPELFPPESATSSEQTDIYAYGMVLWEISMGGQYRLPFSDCFKEGEWDLEEVVQKKQTRGEQQEVIPPDCDFELRREMMSCWRRPSERPSATSLADSLETLFHQAEAAAARRGSQPPGYQASSMAAQPALSPSAHLPPPPSVAVSMGHSDQSAEASPALYAAAFGQNSSSVLPTGSILSQLAIPSPALSHLVASSVSILSTAPALSVSQNSYSIIPAPKAALGAAPAESRHRFLSPPNSEVGNGQSQSPVALSQGECSIS